MYQLSEILSFNNDQKILYFNFIDQYKFIQISGDRLWELTSPAHTDQDGNCWLVRVSLFIELGGPRDLGKGWRGDLGTFIISRPT